MKRILLVDDSPSIVEAAYDELEEKGYVVDVAYNGKKALKLLEENPEDLPDLIVMDIEMPKMRGDEAARIIRATPAWSKIPIIALTGISPDSLGAQAGLFDNYLLKPFGFEKMLALVEEMIGAAD
jgi:CheY-like chemotaxis protein